MNKHHNVQSLDFEAHWMILTVDDQTVRLPIAQTSSRLANASDAERKLYQVSPSGYGIHWPAIDEDLSIDGLLKLAQTLPQQTTA
ncbi:hypothetical protein XM38_027660 [Halomicronema hongdechloris C2206]|uniref:DUF2442 domain-containing protein n=1 Tax=Halomicronema hongdechloris C2206 TaxID=1641165 RepID=A0A1Z3HNE4_9CYAN|nr:DUF2442 domain-containing protein [Halomicronema hongdechloris]ASC71812.1 hypothetical protein XM38_027660 [Halomicronema hongdechloris C2206]